MMWRSAAEEITSLEPHIPNQQPYTYNDDDNEIGPLKFKVWIIIGFLLYIHKKFALEI